MIATILALGISAFSVDPLPPGVTLMCQAAVIRSGEAWCEIDGTPVRCQMIQPPEEVECIVTGSCAYAAHDPLPGEVLMIILRSMEQGVASPVCTHDGSALDCGTVEYVEDSATCP